MHRQLHPRRRPPAAAPRTFLGRTVTPSPWPTPVADVTTTSATTAPAALAGLVPPDGTHIKIVARPTGANALIRATRPLSTGRPVQARQMSSSHFPGPACHTDAAADTSTGMTQRCDHAPSPSSTFLRGGRLCAPGVSR